MLDPLPTQGSDRDGRWNRRIAVGPQNGVIIAGVRENDSADVVLGDQIDQS